MVGNPVSFNQPEMQEVVSAMDLALNTALRHLLSGDAQSFAVTAKVSFVPYDGVFRMEYEVGHQFEPIKQKKKGALQSPLCFARDGYGLPILFCVSDQVSLDETLEARKDDEPEPEPYVCTKEDCPLCDFGNICELHEDGSTAMPYEDSHIITAAENFRCTRRFVRKRYGEIIEEGRSDD